MLLTLEDVAERLSSPSGKKPSKRSVRRWAAEGVRVGRSIVRLKVVRMPQGVRVTEEALGQFIAALNPSERDTRRLISAPAAETEENTLDRVTG